MMREKKLCILWNFNGKVYFGGWKGEMIGCEGVKEGVGVEWFPGSNYLHSKDTYITANIKIIKNRVMEL